MSTISNLDELKPYDVLHAYCAAELGEVVEYSNYAMCGCPFGSHNRHEHLEITEKDGVGVAICRACGRGGTVYDVAAAHMGVDLSAPGQFVEVAKHIATVTGVELELHSSSRKSSRYTGRGAHLRRPPSPPSRKPSTRKPVAIEYLDEFDEQAALASADRALTNPKLMKLHADALHIPLAELMRHADIKNSAHGLLGLSPDGRLLYIYTHTEAKGKGGVVAVKLRGNRTQDERKLFIRDGYWQTGNPMMYNNNKPIRFLFSAGKPACLFGVEALKGHLIAMLTEGESDKLALDYVLGEFRKANMAEGDSGDDTLSEEEIPVAVAKPSAGTFRLEWAYQLAGRAVIILADADEAGRKGAETTAAMLRKAGINNISLWTPPAGFKDVREMVATCDPIDIISNILENNQL